MAKLRDVFLDSRSRYEEKYKVLNEALSEGEQWLKKAPDCLKGDINIAGAGVGTGATSATVGLLVGFALAPFTFGGSLVVAGAAVAVTAGRSAAVITTLTMEAHEANEKIWGEQLKRVKRVNALIQDVNSAAAEVNRITDQIVADAKMMNKEVSETISAILKAVPARLVTVEAIVVEVATRSTRVCTQKEALGLHTTHIILTMH